MALNRRITIFPPARPDMVAADIEHPPEVAAPVVAAHDDISVGDIAALCPVPGATFYHGTRTRGDAATPLYVRLGAPRTPEGEMRRIEIDALDALIAADSRAARYVPAIVARRNNMTVFGRWEPQSLYALCGGDYMTLVPDERRIPGIHIGWMLRRGLEFLQYMAKAGAVHGHLLPHNLFIDGANHGVRVIDFSRTTPVRQLPRRAPFFPQTWRALMPSELRLGGTADASADLYCLVKGLIWANGGNVTQNSLHPSEPAWLQNFMRSMVLDSPAMRPAAAEYSALWRRLGDQLRQTFGSVFEPLPRAPSL